jgi:hypothetical protein
VEGIELDVGDAVVFGEAPCDRRLA